MTLTPVYDLNHPDLKIYASLRDNAFREDNSFIADSPKVVNILLQTDLKIKSILATKEYYDEYYELINSKNIPVLYLADKTLMENIVGHKIHHNCMMHGIRPVPTPFDDLDNQIIMLDAITSAQNIGSIARSAAAMGVHSYLLPEQAPHPFGRRALRVSMGYASHLKIHLYTDIVSTLKLLQDKGYQIFAAEVTEDSIALSNINVPDKWVLLMGHEGHGISDEILRHCDHVVSIEMIEGIKSFNVGIAASILMYTFKHR